MFNCMIKEKDLIMEVRGTAIPLDLAETPGWLIREKVLASKGQSCIQIC